MNSSQIDNALSDAEQWVDRVRTLYDQFFEGAERIEPLGVRQEVEHRLHTIRAMELETPGQRFRFSNLQQRYNALRQYWARSLKDHQRRKPSRDRAPARRRRNTDPDGMHRSGGTIEVELSIEELHELEQEAALPVPVANSKIRILPPESELRLLHKEFLAARRRNQEHTHILFESMVKKLRSTVPELEKRFASKPVTFQIKKRDGKVVLEPTIRSS